MTIIVTAALGLLAGSFAALWWAEIADRRKLAEDRLRWRSSRRRAHGGRCSFSGRPGFSHEAPAALGPGSSYVVECPRCCEIFVQRTRTLPEHEDNRTR